MSVVAGHVFGMLRGRRSDRIIARTRTDLMWLRVLLNRRDRFSLQRF
jgi:hypothetical protein